MASRKLAQQRVLRIMQEQSWVGFDRERTPATAGRQHGKRSPGTEIRVSWSRVA